MCSGHRYDPVPRLTVSAPQVRSAHPAIDALRDPRTTWYLHRPVQHLAFALGDAPQRGIERGDVEIISPRRNRNVWRLSHHPALVLAVDGEELIGTHRPHVDRR